MIGDRALVAYAIILALLILAGLLWRNAAARRRRERRGARARIDIVGRGGSGA